MNAWWLVGMLASVAPVTPSEYQYASAAVELPADLTPTRALGSWHGMVVERGLSPDVVDHRDGYALGDWLVRPHVCSGQVRYHGVVSNEKALRFFVVAECFGQGVNLDRAAAGLAEELAKRLGPKATWANTKVDQVPSRLWEARTFRGNNRPPETSAPAAPASPAVGAPKP